MKAWAEYFYKEAGTNNYVPAVGDRSVIRLDARRNVASLLEDAKSENGIRRPTYDAVRILRGDSLLLAKPATEIVPLT